MVITSNKQDKCEVISPAGRSEGDGWKAPWRLRNEMVSIHGGSVSKARLRAMLEKSRGVAAAAVAAGGKTSLSP